jgi:hypothetical protein
MKYLLHAALRCRAYSSLCGASLTAGDGYENQSIGTEQYFEPQDAHSANTTVSWCYDGFLAWNVPLD